MRKKRCRKCQVVQSMTAFSKDGVRPGGLRATCRTCQAEYNRIRHRGDNLLRLYGITEAQYDAMLEAQLGVCAICLEPPVKGKVLDVDHNHETGEARALLCHGCNLAVGFYEKHGFMLELYVTEMGGNEERSWQPRPFHWEDIKQAKAKASERTR